MKDHVTRRDFLKVAGLLPLSFVMPPSIGSSHTAQQSQQNVIIIVFDALSARHISLYGYRRDTMPNLSKLADRAIVYHNHYAGGNFTTPGTASLLTGVNPWKHRAFENLGTVDEAFLNKNIFSAFPDYRRITFTHNLWASAILHQFTQNVELYIPANELLLTDDYFIPELFRNDEDVARLSWTRAIKKEEEGYAYSLFLSHLYERVRDWPLEKLRSEYPRGLPMVFEDNYFLLEQSIDRVAAELKRTGQPFLGYFHFWPPHDPYCTPREFYGRFINDGLKFIQKPRSIFSTTTETVEELDQYRIAYDESILYVDREFGRLVDYLEKSGSLANTWLVLTSDHGEMFDRGINGHTTPVLYEPIVRVPLLIFEPGRESREDIYELTSAVDLLPTLLRVTGHIQAEWTEGVVLPPFNHEFPQNRNIFVLEAKENEKDKPITIGTTAIISDHFKLTNFFGYEVLGGINGELIELYDLENDPEELNNLYSTKDKIGSELLNELKVKLKLMNEPYL
jgi:arylsulfatase A-like enzyme